MSMIETWGIRGGPAPRGPFDEIIDMRRYRNPYHDKRLRKLRGTDAEVQTEVLRAPGIKGLFGRLFVNLASGRYTCIGIYCTAGRHRSVALAELLAGALRAGGVPVEVRHRDLD